MDSISVCSAGFCDKALVMWYMAVLRLLVC